MNSPQPFSTLKRSVNLYLLHLRQPGQCQQYRCHKPESSGGQRCQPVHIPQDRRPGADIRQRGFREGSDRPDQSRPGPGFPVGFHMHHTPFILTAAQRISAAHHPSHHFPPEHGIPFPKQVFSLQGIKKKSRQIRTPAPAFYPCTIYKTKKQQICTIASETEQKKCRTQKTRRCCKTPSRKNACYQISTDPVFSLPTQ